jgi:hypothetical protein
MVRLRKGAAQSPAAPLSQATYDAVQSHVDRHPNVSLILGVRRPSALQRAYDYRIVVASESPLHRSFEDEIINIVHEEMADEELRIEVIAVQANWGSEAASAKAE